MRLEGSLGCGLTFRVSGLGFGVWGYLGFSAEGV